MTGRRAVLLVAGLLIVGVGIAFLIIGLDRADKTASVTGALVAIAALGFSVWAYMKPGLRPLNMRKQWRVWVTRSIGVLVGDHSEQTNNFGADITKKK
jgi:fatty acid desaturase